MPILAITSEVRDSIKNLVAFAEKNPISLESAQNMAIGLLAPVGDDPSYAITIPVGYRVVFSIEEQAMKVRHLSVSVDRQDKMPSPNVIEELLPLFGFKNILEDLKIWIEDIGGGQHALNVAEAEQY